MGSRQAAFGASMALWLTVAPSTPSAACGSKHALLSPPAAGLRTDRLSAARLETWKEIVGVVGAEGRHGRPLYPTLRRLFDAVNGGPHTVFVEMPDTKGYLGGRFEVTKVDPGGRTHEAILILNLRAIDKASTGPASAQADGFIPFRGLTRKERYAEVLGHELAHAVWHLASTERAGLAHGLQGRLEERVRALRKERLDRMDPLAAGTDLLRLAEELERPAAAAERAVWEELQAAKRSRGARSEEREVFAAGPLSSLLHP